MLVDECLLNPDLKCPNCNGSDIITEAYLPSVDTHKPIARNLWQRWMDWSGSFLVISILLHILLLGGATMLVVHVVGNRKEKMKFTAPPPSSNAYVEHKVKPSKKTAAAAPAISKRITSSAMNTSVALPSMDLNSTGPDVMASVMSGLGSSGLGSGDGGGAGGAAGMASMPLQGLTAFGFKGPGTRPGLVGHIYDLKQTADRQPTNIKDEGRYKNPHIFDAFSDYKKQEEKDKVDKDQSTLGKRADILTESVKNHAQVLQEYINKNWDEAVLNRFYKSKEQLTAYQIFIPYAAPQEALKAFGVENEIKPTHFLVHYKGFVTAPKDGRFRFRVQSMGNLLLIRFNGKNVFGFSWSPLLDLSSFQFNDPDPHPPGDISRMYDYRKGPWFTVQNGEKYPIEILMENGEKGFFSCIMIEEENPAKPYATSYWHELYPQDRPTYVYPIFALAKGTPLKPYDKAWSKTAMTPIAGFPDPKNWRAFWKETIPEYAPEPVVFAGVK